MVPSMMKIQRQPLRPSRPLRCMSCWIVVRFHVHISEEIGGMTYTIGQDTGKGGGDTADKIECRVPFSNLIYRVTLY